MAMPDIEISLQREYALGIRDSLLKQVDMWERILGISPRTSELRREMKREPVVESEKKEGENGQTCL
jgi:hypothetical protein